MLLHVYSNGITVQNDFMNGAVCIHVANGAIVDEFHFQILIVTVTAVKCLVLHLTETLHLVTGSTLNQCDQGVIQLRGMIDVDRRRQNSQSRFGYLHVQ